ARHRVVATTGGGAATGQPGMHADTTTGTTPAHIGGGEGDVAHAFAAAGDDEVIVAGAHLQARLDHRLQTRTAAAVDLHAGNRHRQTGIQCHHTPNRRRLAAGIAVPENDVLHCLAGDSGSVQQTTQGGDAEVDGGLRLEHSAVPADRCAYRFT